MTDPGARYFGAELCEDTLIPDEGAIIGVTQFDEWLKRLTEMAADPARRVPSLFA